MRFLIGTLIVIGLAITACGGGNDEDSISTEGLAPIVISTDVSVGGNIFMLGLINRDGEPINGAKTVGRFFEVSGNTGVFRGEGELEAVVVTRTYTETHPGGIVHTHEAGELGIYQVVLPFDKPGLWAVQVVATIDGKKVESNPAQFQVREKTLSPGLGDPAPLSRQKTLADVKDIAEIDTADPRDPGMHSVTITDAVRSGRPTVIVFSTPAFCTTRVCGPTYQAVVDLYPKYKDSANFVHVEPYDLEAARSGQGLRALPWILDEWKLQSEPWVFVVDKQGKVAAKWQGFATTESVENAIKALLQA